MVWQKIKPEKSKDLFEFNEKGQVLQGVLISSEKEVGKYKSTLHKIQGGDLMLWAFWGNSQLDDLLEGKIGKRVRITLVDPAFEFKNGTGRFFEAEEWIE